MTPSHYALIWSVAMKDALSVPTTFAFDLDGSLLRSDGTVSERTRSALRMISLQGHEILLVTGRPQRQVREIAASIGHTGLSVCSNGAVVYAPASDEIQLAHRFPSGAIARVVGAARGVRADFAVAAECMTGLLPEPDFPATDIVAAYSDPASATDVLELLLYSRQGVDDRLAAQVRRALEGLAEVSHGTAGGPLEVTMPGVNKGSAVRNLLARAGRGLDDLIAFGDMPNDLSLLTIAGRSYAMSNAHPDVLAAVTEHAPGNDDDGIAVVVEGLLARRAHSPTLVLEPPRVSVAVAAHPQRLTQVEAMRARYPELELDVVLDPLPDGPPMAMRTARRAWSSVPAHASHRLVVQDDVTLCPGFLSAVQDVVRAAPAEAISLFAEWGSRAGMSVRLAALLGYDFSSVVNNYVPTQGLILPADVARGFDTYVADFEPGTAEDDLAMARYLERRGVSARITVPNLVEHSDGASLVGNDFSGARLSTCFAAAGVPDVRWNTRVFTPQLVPFFCGRTETAQCVVIDGPLRAMWRTLPARQVMNGKGVGSEQVAAELSSALQRHPAGGLLQRNVSPVHLRETWSTAYLLGLVLSDAMDPAIEFDEACEEDRAALALSTMAAGAMRSHVQVEYLQMLQALLIEGVRTGFACGAAARRATTSRSA